MVAPNCLIYERDVGGHRLHHVRHLVESLLEVGCEVSVATRSDAREKEEYRVHLKALEPQFRFIPGPPLLPPGLRNGWHLGTDFKNTVKAAQPDRVYIPFSDYFTQSAALRCLVTGRRRFTDPPVEGHLNRGTFAYPMESLRDILRSKATRQLVLRSPWQITHLLDPWMFDALKGRTTTTEFRIIPEPVEPLPELCQDDARRARRKVPVDGRYIAMIGGLVPGKGLDKLLTAFSRAKLATDDRVLLVGKMSESIRHFVHEQHDDLIRAGRLLYIDRYVSDFELDCGFVAADIVVVAHERLIGSSGTLVRAAHAGRLLVTTDYGWAGWATRTFELGITAQVADVDVLAAALETAFRTSSDYRRSSRGERFCQYHTLDNQKAHWLAGIGRDCGIPLGKRAERIDWNWVLETVEPQPGKGEIPANS